ncbi:MAG: tRNA pseudouridine55 synthase [Acidobacteriota bacterium]|jgi:tRNA pseudouridine55 synthase|nr:tRNA pseudouridine55 synthase [Acidobacteriota bacterium]
MKDGLLLIDKEPGCTSHDVVQRVRRILKQKKSGHCGTLDPDATGLLLLTLGNATRLTRFLIRAPKVYSGEIRFGIATDTYDASGTVTAERPCEGLTLPDVATAMERFQGTFEQQPPPYSAKKINGVKYYELARRGEEVPQDTKEVTVFDFSPQGELAGPPDVRLRFRLACTSGTYARTLAHDLGAALGCGAHLSALRRLKIGPFEVDQAVTLPVLDARVTAGEPLAGTWIPFDQIPLPFGEVTADPQQEQRISHGQTVLVRELAGEEGDWVKLINRRQELIAVGTVIERIGSAGVGIVQPKVVFR